MALIFPHYVLAIYGLACLECTWFDEVRSTHGTPEQEVQMGNDHVKKRSTPLWRSKGLRYEVRYRVDGWLHIQHAYLGEDPVFSIYVYVFCYVLC